MHVQWIHVLVFGWGLFQKLSSGGVGRIFFQTRPLPGHTWSQSPPPTLRTSPPTMDQIRFDPQDKLTPPPLGHVVNKTPPPQDKKCLHARIISGTALITCPYKTVGLPSCRIWSTSRGKLTLLRPCVTKYNNFINATAVHFTQRKGSKHSHPWCTIPAKNLTILTTLFPNKRLMPQADGPNRRWSRSLLLKDASILVKGK